jgi:hypothetical protein
MSVNKRVQFFTIADRRFFAGAVAMINSLHVTGNHGEVIVLDVGLTAEQVASLDPHATVVRIPADELGHPVLAKAYPHVLGAEGTIALIDSDMLVTASLSGIISVAEAGRICVFPNHWMNRDRWFAEWQRIFELPQVPRHQTYLNAGFICFSTHHWPELLRQYWEACQKVIPTNIGRGSEDPTSEADQDAMNAILMSVVPPDAIAELPRTGEAFRDQLVQVRIIDEQQLTCSLEGEPTTILHYTRSPKAWETRNWWRVRRDAFTRLLPRLLFADDVPIKLPRRSVPIWARPGRSAIGSLHLIDSAHRLVAPIRRKVRIKRR